MVSRKRDWDRVERGSLVDLAAMENGAYLVAANNQHFGAASQMLMPGRGVNMGDGWETRRRREPGNDWAIVALARPGVIQEDRSGHRSLQGQLPGPLLASGGDVTGGTDDSLVTQAMFWPVLLGEQKLKMDNRILRKPNWPRSVRYACALQYLSRTAACRVCVCGGTA